MCPHAFRDPLLVAAIGPFEIPTCEGGTYDLLIPGAWSDERAIWVEVSVTRVANDQVVIVVEYREWLWHRLDAISQYILNFPRFSAFAFGRPKRCRHVVHLGQA